MVGYTPAGVYADIRSGGVVCGDISHIAIMQSNRETVTGLNLQLFAVPFKQLLSLGSPLEN